MDIQAVQINDRRIEYHKPDLTLAYANLAPLVLEAGAFLESDNMEKAKESLDRARSIVRQVSTVAATFELVEPHSADSRCGD